MVTALRSAVVLDFSSDERIKEDAACWRERPIAEALRGNCRTLPVGSSVVALALMTSIVDWQGDCPRLRFSMTWTRIFGLAVLAVGLSSACDHATSSSPGVDAGADAAEIPEPPCPEAPVPVRVLDGAAYYFIADRGDIFFSGTGGLQRLPVAGGPAQILDAKVSIAGALALDDTSLYYVDDISSSGSIFRVPRQGSAVRTMLTETHGAVPPKYSLEVDGHDIYWTANEKGAEANGTSMPGTVRLFRMPKDASAAPAVLLSSPSDVLSRIPLSLSADTIYVSAPDPSTTLFHLNHVYRLAKAARPGGAPEQIVDDACLSGLLVVGTQLICAPTTERVHRRPLADLSQHTDLYPAKLNVGGTIDFVTDGASVYLATTSHGGMIAKLSIAGTAADARILACNLAQLRGLAVDDQYIYWIGADFNGVFKLPK